MITEPAIINDKLSRISRSVINKRNRFNSRPRLHAGDLHSTAAIIAKLFSLTKIQYIAYRPDQKFRGGGAIAYT